MEEYHHLHDKFFKMSFSFLDVAKDFFVHNLPPPLLEHLDLERLNICNASFLEANFQERFSDMVYLVKALDSPLDDVYLLVEHQSSANRDIPKRLLEYMLAIVNQHQKQHGNTQSIPIVIPILIYQGQERYTSYPKSCCLEMVVNRPELLPYSWSWSPCLIDFNVLEDGVILQQRFAGLYTFIHKHIASHTLGTRLGDLWYATKRVYDAMDEQHKEHTLLDDYVTNSLYYALSVGKLGGLGDFLQGVKTIPLIGEKIMSSLAERFRELGFGDALDVGEARGLAKGRAKGLAEGLAEGRIEGAQQCAREIALKLKQEGLPEETIAKATGLSLQELAILFTSLG